MMRLLLRVWHSPTAMTWGSLAVRLSAVLLILPVVLVRFGPADVALWQLYSTLFLLAMMLDFGLAPTFVRVLAYARGGATLADISAMPRSGAGVSAQRDPAVLLAIMACLRWLYPRLAGGAGLVLALIGTWALMRPVSLSSQPESAWWAWAVVVLTTTVAIWGGAYSAALQGMNRVADLRRWEVATGLGQTATSLAVLWLGYGLLSLVLAFQVWAVIGALRNRWLLQRLHPELFAGLASRRPDVLAVVWPAAWRSGVGVLMSHGVIQASGLAYSQIAPAAEVAAYLLAIRLAMVISQFCQAPFYSKLPRLAELQASGDLAAQLRLAQRGMRLAYWVFVAGAVGVALAVQPLMQLIGSQTPFVPPGVWAVLALAFFAERFGAMHLQLYSLTNHIIWHVANGVTGILMMLLALLAYKHLGEYAFPVAMLASYVGFYCIYSVVHSRAAFKFRLLSFESRSAVPAAAALCTGLVLALRFPIHL